MKHIIITAALVFASILGYAQSTNPLNYSGRMYVEAIEIYTTPRYVSYEDHAIVSQQMRIPPLRICKCEMDFKNGTVIVDQTTMKVKVNATKKYNTNYG